MQREVRTVVVAVSAMLGLVAVVSGPLLVQGSDRPLVAVGVTPWLSAVVLGVVGGLTSAWKLGSRIGRVSVAISFDDFFVALGMIILGQRELLVLGIIVGCVAAQFKRGRITRTVFNLVLVPTAICVPMGLLDRLAQPSPSGRFMPLVVLAAVGMKVLLEGCALMFVMWRLSVVASIRDYLRDVVWGNVSVAVPSASLMIIGVDVVRIHGLQAINVVIVAVALGLGFIRQLQLSERVRLLTELLAANRTLALRQDHAELAECTRRIVNTDFAEVIVVEAGFVLRHTADMSGTRQARTSLGELPALWRDVIDRGVPVQRRVPRSSLALPENDWDQHSEYELIAVPLVNADGICLGMIAAVSPQNASFGFGENDEQVLSDLGSVSTLWIDSKWAATHDPLTKLANRRRFNDAVQDTLDTGHSGAVLLLDLNGFKQVNDTYGHTAGDIVLIEQSKRLLAVCGVDDVVARLGGDEFVIWTEHGNTEALIDMLAQRLRVPIDLYSETAVVVSASIGIATTQTHGTNLTNLLKAADEAMYQRKQALPNHKPGRSIESSLSSS